jgi:hypothetical protein
MADTLSKQEREAIAGAAIATAEAYSDDPLLTVDELSELTLEELDAYLRSKGSDIDLERMEVDIRASLGSTALHLERGRTLDDAQLADLEARIERAVIKGARTATNKTLGDLRQAAMEEGDDRPDSERQSMWVAVLDERCCSDCEDRHGVVFAADMWEGNAPRDGMTKCEGNCRCLLVPVSSEIEEGSYVTRPND